MNGDVLVPVVVTFLIVNVILLVRVVAKGQLIRWGAPPAAQPPEPRPAADPPGYLVAAEVAAPAPDAPGYLVAAEVAASGPPEAGQAFPWSGRDVLTGLGDEATWNRRVADETARVERYPRPVTIVRFELDGLERLTGLLGEEAGDRLLRAMADTLRRLARDTDHVARLGRGGFGVLMPETSEEAAVGYVERVIRACELWLESGATAVRLAAGWAAASAEVGLDEAQRVATERMHGGQLRDTRRLKRVAAAQDSAPSGAGRRPVTGMPAWPVTDVGSAATPRLDRDKCRVPDCDHKQDHRRDRQR